ncbi:bacterial regulatory s, gntR family protein [Collimonas arenae]|uniref:Bacterial regulatory s, gntR family protein n=1 Tax=Collimonas arenae TaxID=279058 RepID=A0A127PJY8_9BURK|nr:MarR family transcriptional regulator [Collimonas arenae]AMO98098.1 bacterial regulatory s, gntR family protein [Collimonas arenae]AMP07965.1 bacterial regulatory s, gntR family protein [Collimonas arenae]
MFDHCLYFNTTALARIVEREWLAAYQPFDLTPPQGFVLRAVLRQPGMLNRELAELLGISRPTASRLLDHLDVKKLIERRSSAADGRESHIFPTEAALALDAPINAVSAEVAQRLRQQIGSSQFDDAIGAMREIREIIG